MKKEEFNLSEKKHLTTTNYDGKIEHVMYDDRDVKEFIRLQQERIAKCRNLLLNHNTISKNYIEISEFQAQFNEMEEDLDKLAGEYLIDTQDIKGEKPIEKRMKDIAESQSEVKE